jgi:hypothetical protein
MPLNHAAEWEYNAPMLKGSCSSESSSDYKTLSSSRSILKLQEFVQLECAGINMSANYGPPCIQKTKKEKRNTSFIGRFFIK